MRIEAENAAVVAPLQRIAAAVQAGGGYVSPEFIVRERGGQFSCAVAGTATETGVEPGTATEPGTVLVHYPPRIRPVLTGIEWEPHPTDLVPLAGTGEVHRFGPVQRELFEAWLELVNLTGRLAHIRAHLPAMSVSDEAVRAHLAAGGFVLGAATDETARTTAVAWHSSIGRTASGERTAVLLPLKHLVNHHHTGAHQAAVPGAVSVVTSATSNQHETFEYYGDLDAAQLLITFGYLATDAPLVHAIPGEVKVPGLGTITVARRPRRAEYSPEPASAAEPSGAAPLDRDVPLVTPTDRGLAIEHLTFRAGSRTRVGRLLAMTIRARLRSAEAEAHRLAHLVLEQLAAHTDRYYADLEQLVNARGTAGSSPAGMAALAEMSRIQRARLSASA